jgi:hypothetical protein
MTICPCDKPEETGLERIAAGLTSLPRQLCAFPEVRRALMAGIGGRAPFDQPPLAFESDVAEVVERLANPWEIGRALLRVGAAAVEERQLDAQRRKGVRAKPAPRLIDVSAEFTRRLGAPVPSLPNEVARAAGRSACLTDRRTVSIAIVELVSIETRRKRRLTLPSHAPIPTARVPAGATILGIARRVSAAASATGSAAATGSADSGATTGAAGSASTACAHTRLETGTGWIAGLRPLSAVRACAALSGSRYARAGCAPRSGSSGRTAGATSGGACGAITAGRAGCASRPIFARHTAGSAGARIIRGIASARDDHASQGTRVHEQGSMLHSTSASERAFHGCRPPATQLAPGRATKEAIQ